MWSAAHVMIHHGCTGRDDKLSKCPSFSMFAVVVFDFFFPSPLRGVIPSITSSLSCRLFLRLRGEGCVLVFCTFPGIVTDRDAVFFFGASFSLSPTTVPRHFLYGI